MLLHIVFSNLKSIVLYFLKKGIVHRATIFLFWAEIDWVSSHIYGYKVADFFINKNNTRNINYFINY